MQLEIATFQNYIIMSDTWIYVLRPGYAITIVADILTANIGARSSATTMLTRLWKTTQSHDLYFTGIKTGAYMYYNAGIWSRSTTRQIISTRFIHWNQITTLRMVTKIITTRTTRTPVFWDTPTAPWLPIPVIHIRSQVKTRQSQSYTFNFFLKFCKKL